MKHTIHPFLQTLTIGIRPSVSLRGANDKAHSLHSMFSTEASEMAQQVKALATNPDEHAQWKKRMVSYKLSSDFHMGTVFLGGTHIHTHKAYICKKEKYFHWASQGGKHLNFSTQKEETVRKWVSWYTLRACLTTNSSARKQNVSHFPVPHGSLVTVHCHFKHQTWFTWWFNFLD